MGRKHTYPLHCRDIISTSQTVNKPALFSGGDTISIFKAQFCTNNSMQSRIKVVRAFACKTCRNARDSRKLISLQETEPSFLKAFTQEFGVM